MYFDVGTRSKKYYIGYSDESFEVLLIFITNNSYDVGN